MSLNIHVKYCLIKKTVSLHIDQFFTYQFETIIVPHTY